MSRLVTIPVLLASCLIAVGCASAPKAKPPSACEHETATATDAASWWEAEPSAALDCPPGTTRRDVATTKPAPPGLAVFCELPCGVRHGPYALRGADDEALELGFWVHGEKHGTWIRYDGITGGWLKESVSCGRVVQRQPAQKP